MRVKSKIVMLSAIVAMQIHLEAQAAFQGNDETTQAHCQRYRENTTAAKQKELEKYTPKPANEFYSEFSCLDKILNTRINIFTMPSLDGVLQGIMNAATNRACSAVMGGWNQAVGQANGTLGTAVNVPYVGNVSGGNIGYGADGTPITINGQAATTQTVQQQSQQAVTNNQSTFEAAKNKLINVFK